VKHSACQSLSQALSDFVCGNVPNHSTFKLSKLSFHALHLCVHIIVI
jgi:hypothetical protein